MNVLIEIAIGFYQDPTTYTPSNTAITPLGNVNKSPSLFYTIKTYGLPNLTNSARRIPTGSTAAQYLL